MVANNFRIFHEHIIQILTITILNFCWALYGTVQAVEVKIELGELSDLSKCVNQSSVVSPPDFLGNDIPCVIVLLMLAFIMSYLSYKLYKQFGWVNYKRIGGDPKMRYIYKKHLIFLMLLKLNLLSMLLFMIPSLSLIILLISNISKLQDKGFLIGFIIYHLAVTVMVLILEILAYRFVATEHRLGMIIFLVLWIAVIVDFVFATVSAFALFAQLKSFWYFGIIILNKNETQEESTPQNPGGLAHIWDDLEFEPSREKKWTIDE
ncbi:Golgi apparatus membrane protein [Gigaspora margarita]|uniref:Golgi apparatus membrane protein n=1 Tax=Gigaspora margarita TaxID=4874 RepID=A0A8H3X7C4_GIGMA|nr:Golgi apparatus membrane protein [Gigaspora margarita]